MYIDSSVSPHGCVWHLGGCEVWGGLGRVWNQETFGGKLWAMGICHDRRIVANHRWKQTLNRTFWALLKILCAFPFRRISTCRQNIDNALTSANFPSSHFMLERSEFVQGTKNWAHYAKKKSRPMEILSRVLSQPVGSRRSLNLHFIWSKSYTLAKKGQDFQEKALIIEIL